MEETTEFVGAGCKPSLCKAWMFDEIAVFESLAGCCVQNGVGIPVTVVGLFIAVVPFRAESIDGECKTVARAVSARGR